MKRVLVFALAAALTTSGSARAASSVPDAAVQVAAAVAGHPTQVVCDADVNPSPKPSAPGFFAPAWTVIGAGPIHLVPALCSNMSAKVGSAEFANAIGTLVREASIAGPVRSEACASLVQAVGVYDVLRRFYNVPFFTRLSWSIGTQVLANVRAGPKGDYQPEACRWPG